MERNSPCLDSSEMTDKNGVEAAARMCYSKKAAAQAEQVTTASEAFASILIAVGGFGKWQCWLTVLASLCGFFMSFHSLGAIYLAASPDHWCRIPSLNVNTSRAKELRNITIPRVTNKDGDLAPSKCTYFNYTYTSLSLTALEGDLELDGSLELEEDPEEIYCNSWHYDQSLYTSTLVSEWDLVCGRRWLMSSIQSIFMLGILCGAAIFSTVSDRFGRRFSSLISVVVFTSCSIGAAFSVSFEMLLILRFFIAAACQGMLFSNYLIVMEVVEKNGKTWLPCLCLGAFDIGACILPLIAYYIREWRYLQLTISLPSLVLFSYFWILPESPRWLLMNGRFEEGLTILEKIAKTNGTSLPPKETLDSYISIIKKETVTRPKKTNLKSFLEFVDNVIKLVRTPNMRRRSLISFYGWFVVSSVYYGLSFSGYNLNVSLYLMVLMSSAIAIPFVLLQPLFFIRVGRRIALIVAISLCGIACLVILVVPNEFKWINLVLTAFGRQMANSSFTLWFIFSSELVPTSIRNTSMGVASIFARLGSMGSPFIVDLLGEVYYAIPSTIFGVMALVSGMLSFLLPEPGFRSIPESIEEVEMLPK